MESVVTQRVVFQLSNNDTFIQKSLIRQLNNVLKAIDEIEIEVVTHGYGIDLLLKDTAFENNIIALHEQGVRFLACKNTLDQQNLSEKDLVEFTTVVPSGLAHVIIRQGEGWSYIKASF
jgi:intracellular sulfur oxidation DsrE/DsrF family protein